jgi:hypothetical protein
VKKVSLTQFVSFGHTFIFKIINSIHLKKCNLLTEVDLPSSGLFVVILNKYKVKGFNESLFSGGDNHHHHSYNKHLPSHGARLILIFSSIFL